MSIRIEKVASPIEGLYVLETKPLQDSRGYLERLFCAQELSDLIGSRRLAQINRTMTRRRGTVRGLHFQHVPAMETKIVSCLRGQVFDVAVDLRKESSTYGRWFGERLTGDNHRSMLVPEGFAHGFQTLTDHCEMLYFHTASYDAGAEGGIDALDSALGIDWPLPVSERSERDQSLPRLDDFEGLLG